MATHWDEMTEKEIEIEAAVEFISLLKEGRMKLEDKDWFIREYVAQALEMKNKGG